MTKNIMLSIMVQIISLAVGFVLGLIVPMFIDEYQYSYWQMYALYVSYVGVLHFGLVDGIMLRYSQYNYDQLDKARVGSQFKMMLAITTALAVIGNLVSLQFCEGNFKYVMCLASIGIITKNIFTFASYVLQMTNRINNYATVIISQKIVYGITVLALLAFGANKFWMYCLADLLGDVIAFSISILYNRTLYFGKSIGIKEALPEYGINIKSGGMLMLANLSAMFLLGSAKMIVQWRWDELTFGKISFSFSLSSLFLTFVSAISVVLFPSLRRMKEDELPQLYRKIRSSISPLLIVMMIGYFPGCWLLEMLLPKYAVSLEYLGVLLPMIIYTSKVNLLTNNYLKAYRKEKTMLAVNIISITVAVTMFVVSAYVLNSLTAILISIILAIVFNSVLSEIVVMRIIKIRFVTDFIVEGIMTVAFIVITQSFRLWIACGAYAIVLAVYLVYARKHIKPIITSFKNAFRRKNI